MTNGRATCTAAPWLSIVGIGEDGVDGLSPVARGLIANAEIVFGGKRHVEVARSVIRGAVRPWPSPFDRAISEVVEQRGRSPVQMCLPKGTSRLLISIQRSRGSVASSALIVCSGVFART